MISIVVPVYKSEKFLFECVESIMKQTYTDFELILVDDGSPDNCGIICDKLAKEYDNIYVIHKKNGGASSARNVGIEISHGDFLMFVDSDDTIEKNMLERLFYVQQQTNADVVGSLLHPQRQFTDVDYQQYTSEECVKKLFLRKLDSSPCTKLIRKSYLNNVHFPEGITNEDIVFLYHLYDKCERVCYLNECFYFYRKNIDSVTHSLKDHALDMVINADYLVDEVANNNPDYIEYVITYRDKIYLDFCFLLLRNHFYNKTEYRNRYDYCRNLLMKRFKNILFSQIYSWKYKVKLLLTILYK